MGRVAFTLALLASASTGRRIATVSDPKYRSPVVASQDSTAIVRLLLGMNPALAFNPSGPRAVVKPLATSSHGILPVVSLHRVPPAIASDGNEASATTTAEPTEEVEAPDFLGTDNLLNDNPNLVNELSVPAGDYYKLSKQAGKALDAALNSGEKLIEINFPPFPVSQMEGDSSISADELFSQNLNLATTMLNSMWMKNQREIALTMPDIDEFKLANKIFGADTPYPGVRTWSINSGDRTGPDLLAMAGSFFKQGEVNIVPAEWADAYVFVGFSAAELGAIEELHNLDPDTPKIFFNLNLDQLRGDLGQSGCPPQRLHHEFLCKVKPIFYLRFRFYSLQLFESPWILGYQGNLFRVYPEPWQSLLDQVSNKGFRCVKASTRRPNLGQFKGTVTAALKLENEQAARLAANKADFSDGQANWWEKDVNNEDVSDAWKL